MKFDQVDILLQTAFLEGKIVMHGAYEKAVEGRKRVIAPRPPARESLLRQLEAAAVEEMPLTVGALLRGIRAGTALRPREVSVRLGCPHDVYCMLEADRISPLRVPVDSWRRLARLCSIPADALAQLIRRTHRLVWFRPGYTTSLARFTPGGDRQAKRSAVEGAARELLAKADLLLPRREEARLQALIDAIKK